MFKRAKKAVTGDPLVEFWRWWQAEGGDAFAHAITNGGKFGKLTDTITAKVEAIHPDLVWELSPGETAQHALCVSAGGDWQVRSTAERWLKSAPPSSDVWEFISSRRADPDVADHQLSFAGTDVKLAEMRLRLDIDDTRQLIDVGCFHPSFPDLPMGARDQLSFLVLDWTLGEDDVERWVGSVEALEAAPSDGLPLDALPEAVTALAARQGEDEWAILEGTTKQGARSMVSVRRPLRWIDYPLFDQHLAIQVPFITERDDGMPDPANLDRLRTLEDDVMEVYGDRALFVAHETAEGVRTLHAYADSQDEEIVDAVRAWADEHALGFTTELDPGWRAVDHFR